MIQQQAAERQARRPGPRRMHRRVGAAAVAVLIGAVSVAGCSKDSGDSTAETTVTTPEGPPTDAKAQQKAFDATERVLSTIRLPGAVGVFAKSTKECPSGKAPQVTRTDRSALPPSEVVTMLSDDLQSLGWTYEHLPDGKEYFTKDDFQMVIDVSESDEGTEADVQITSSLAACP